MTAPSRSTLHVRSSATAGQTVEAARTEARRLRDRYAKHLKTCPRCTYGFPCRIRGHYDVNCSAADWAVERAKDRLGVVA